MALVFYLGLVHLVQGYIRENITYNLKGNELDQFLQDYKDYLRVIYFHSFLVEESYNHNAIFKQAVEELTAQGHDIVFAKLDVTKPDSKDAHLKYATAKLPSIVYFLQYTDVHHEYQGELDSKELIEYFPTRLYRLRRFKSEPEFDEVMMQDYPVQGLVLGVFLEEHGIKYDAFIEFAKEHAGIFNFGIAIDDDGTWGLRFDVDEDVIVCVRGPMLVREKDSKFKVLQVWEAPEAIYRFVRKNLYGMIGWYTEDTQLIYNQIKAEFNRPIVSFWFNSNPKLHKSNLRYYLNRLDYPLLVYRQEFESDKKYSFAIADKEIYAKKIKNKPQKDQPFFMMIENVKGDVHIWNYSDTLDQDGTFSGRKLREFIGEFSSGKAAFNIKSEDIPDYTWERNVKYVVGKTFNRHVVYQDYDVLLYVYDRENPSDLELLETIEELGAKYRDTGRLIVAKIDGKLNDLPPDYTTSSFPRLYYLTTEGSKKMKDTDITHESILAFVKRYARVFRNEL